MSPSMSSPGPNRAPAPSASRSTAMAAGASGAAEDAIPPREAGNREDKDAPPQGGAHEQRGTRGEPGRARRGRPPGDGKGTSRRVETPGHRWRCPPYGTDPRVTRLGEPVGPPPYCVLERAPRVTLTGRHRAGIPPSLGRGWRDIAPSPARRGPRGGGYVGETPRQGWHGPRHEPGTGRD